MRYLGTPIHVASGMRCWGRDRPRPPPGVRHETRDRDRRPPNAVKNNRADGGVIGGLSWMGSPVSRFRQWTFPVASWSVGPLKRMCQDRRPQRAYFISIINRARNQDEIICCSCACGSEVYVDVRFNSTWMIKATDYLLESLTLRHRWHSYSRQFYSFYLYLLYL